jgi:hypothetical protein
MSKYLPSKYKRICIDFKLKDWNKIPKRYEICKMKPTAFIREMALRGEIKLYNDERLNELSLQVRRFGNNINQIVHLAQEVKTVNKTDIENLEKHMKSIDEAISDWCKPFKYEVI